MIDDSEKRNRRLAFKLQNSHVCEKRSKYRHRKKLKLGKQNMSDWVTCAEPSRRNTYPGASHTSSRRFLNQNYPKYTNDVVSKILEKIKHNYQMFCQNLRSS